VDPWLSLVPSDPPAASSARRLRMDSIRPRADSPDHHLARICRTIVEHRARP
jgi:hypothetical protein